MLPERLGVVIVEPVHADDDYAPTRRGTDERLDNSSRARAHDRLAAKKARRAEANEEE